MNHDFARERAWTRRHQPRLQRVLAGLPDLTGVRIAFNIHLDIKNMPLLEGLLERGAALFVTTCNPNTVRDEVVAHLHSLGATTAAWCDMPADELDAAYEQAIDWGPTHLCETGADLAVVLHRRADPPPVRAALEGTGSGIMRLQALPLRFPVFNWDDVPIKEGLHNRHMVGLTAWHTFFHRTRLTLHEKRVLVVGYGLVGRGLAASARAYGGLVTVAERDPARAIEALYDGYTVAPLDEALPMMDVIATATGARDVIRADHLAHLRDGAFLLNVGHHANEINVAAMRRYPHSEVLPFVEAFEMEGRTVYLLAGGSMANLVAGYGDSLNAFDVPLSIMAAGVAHIVGCPPETPPGLTLLPRHVWEPQIVPA